MKTLDIRQIVSDFSSNTEGLKLFIALKKEIDNNISVVLLVDKDVTLSSSFLNSSIGAILDDIGINKFKENIKFKGSKTQFNRLSSYINLYNQTYLA